MNPAPRDPPACLQAEGLGLQVGTRVLVDALDLAVAPGEVWALLGPNGAGKTTLLHTLAGLRPAAAGRVRLAGRPLEAWPAAEAARLRGLLPQVLGDAFSASVREVVLLGRHPHLSRWAWEGPDDERRAQDALAAVDLAGFGDRDVLTLSGGERQRVGLAALLAQDPTLLLLDEPLAHLDLHHQVQVGALLRSRAAVNGRAVMLAVHDLNLAHRFATHALVLGPRGHHAGPVDAVMTEAILGEAYGHRLQRAVVGGRTVFVPA